MPPVNSISRPSRDGALVGRIEIRVKPGSKQPGIVVDGAGVIVSVSERAVEGAANAACIAAIAARLRIAPSSVGLVRGAHARRKLLEIAGMTTAQALERISGG
jgi:uncharacterized protein YggU (UPF0235/DUF167 family)